MSNLVIVAIPADDDPIWKVSSEKKPHLTICFLGDVESNPNVDRIMLFVEHAVAIAARGPFYLEVDHREVLGEDKADVFMFRKDWSFRWIKQFRNQLLQNTDIKVAYESADQFPEWQPHITLGYPETPAHEDKIPDYGINMVRFDRIGVWTGDFEGPDWRLEWPEMEMLNEVAWGVDMDLERKAAGRYALEHASVRAKPVEDAKTQTTGYGETFIDGLMDGLAHVGVKGMRWGIRKPPPAAVAPSATSRVPHGAKRKTKVEVKGGENHPAHEDAIKVAEARAKLSKSGPSALSNNELRDVANRLQLENQVSVLTSTKGKQFVSRQLETEGQRLAREGLQKGGKHVIKKAGKGAAVAATTAALV